MFIHNILLVKKKEKDTQLYILNEYTTLIEDKLLYWNDWRVDEYFATMHSVVTIGEHRPTRRAHWMGNEKFLKVDKGNSKKYGMSFPFLMEKKIGKKKLQSIN